MVDARLDGLCQHDGDVPRARDLTARLLGVPQISEIDVELARCRFRCRIEDGRGLEVADTGDDDAVGPGEIIRRFRRVDLGAHGGEQVSRGERCADVHAPSVANEEIRHHEQPQRMLLAGNRRQERSPD